MGVQWRTFYPKFLASQKANGWSETESKRRAESFAREKARNINMAAGLEPGWYLFRQEGHRSVTYGWGRVYGGEMHDRSGQYGDLVSREPIQITAPGLCGPATRQIDLSHLTDDQMRQMYADDLSDRVGYVLSEYIIRGKVVALDMQAGRSNGMVSRTTPDGTPANLITLLLAALGESAVTA